MPSLGKGSILCIYWGEWRLVRAHGGVKTVSRNSCPRTYQVYETKEKEQLSLEPHKELNTYIIMVMAPPCTHQIDRELSWGLQLPSIPVETACYIADCCPICLSGPAAHLSVPLFIWTLSFSFKPVLSCSLTSCYCNFSQAPFSSLS